MRKNFKSALFLGIGFLLNSFTVNAQFTYFDDLILSPNSYWDGSDLSGTHNNGVFTSEFISGNIIFPNLYDTSWGAPGYWLGGFAYSNMTDTVTSGPTNKYSSITGSGVDGHQNFVVASNYSYLKYPNIYSISTIYVTNSTYAHNSMRDGDGFAKKFGGPSGDDPDWFKLTIFTYEANVLIDSTEFYLADYRFSDNSQDYIVKDWTQITFNPFYNLIDSVYFSLSSSDVGMWGINTPTFFCIGNIIENEVSIAENNSLKNLFSIYPNPATSTLFIKSEEIITSINVIDIAGKTILTTSCNKSHLNLDVSDLRLGVYFIQVISNGKAQVQKFIKQ